MNENAVAVPEMSAQEEAYWAGDGDWSEYEGEQTSEPETEQAVPDEEPEEQAEAADVESSVQTEEPAAQAEESFELVYNGERLTRNREEVIRLAQIGMNHDRAVERARREGAAEHQQTIDALNRFADRMGQTPENLLNWMEQQMHANAVAELVDTGMERSTAEELVQLREGQRMQNAQQQRAQQQQAAQADNLKPWREFWEQYPEKAAAYQSGGAPQAFVEAINKGLSPVAAQMAVELAELREQNKTLQSNVEALRQGKENKKAAPPAVGSFGGKTEMDPFLQGFLAED
jgi:hypothetical protein